MSGGSAYTKIMYTWFPKHAGLARDTELHWAAWLTDPWFDAFRHFREVSSFLWIQLASCFATYPIRLIILLFCLCHNTQWSAEIIWLGYTAQSASALYAGQSEWWVHNSVKELTLTLVFYFPFSKLTLCIFLLFFFFLETWCLMITRRICSGRR